MKKTIQFFVIMACVFFLSCVQNQEPAPKTIELNEWHILGPFVSDNQDNYLQFNNLEKWGFTEEKIDFSLFKRITTDSGISNSVYSSDLRVIDFCKHFGFDPFNDNISGNAYAACTFNVNDTSNYYINFSSDDGGKVYLNNEEIINLEKADLVAKYEVYKKVKLKKGENFILIKVNNGLYNWQAFIEIEKFSEESLNEHYNLMNKLNNNKFFKLSVYDTTSVFVPSDKLPNTKLNYEILTKEDSSVMSGKIFKEMPQYPDISKLPEGLYYIKLHLEDRELVQDIYKGDLIEAIKETIHYLENFDFLDKELKATIDANVFRFNHLLKPSNRGEDYSEKQEWQRKLIYIYKTFTEIRNNIGSNKAARGIPHAVLRSFVSKIDEQNQYYISHAPRDYKPEEKYPVVIFTPYYLSIQRPYLESMRVADIDIRENLQYFSDRYKLIVLEPFCREVCWYNLNSIGEADLFEVLKSAQTNYNIDTTRIFLAGSCAGADKALNFAVKYPHLFAGMGLASPSFSANKSSQEWLQKKLPFNYIENIRNMPILVMHSVNDRHTSINNSLYLEHLAKENQLTNFTFIKTENDVEEYFWYKYSEKIFEFFSNIQPKGKTDNSTLKVSELKYNTNGIITILERETQDYSEVSLKVKNNKIRLETSNAKNFSIKFEKLLLDNTEPVSIYENGKLLYENSVSKNNIFIKNSLAGSNRLLKFNEIEGPFADIFTDRFIIVIGSQGKKEDIKKNEKVAQFFHDAWEKKYFNGCLVKYDYQIDSSDIENANLLIIGNYLTNKALSDIREKIPLEISDEGITMNGHLEKGENLNFYLVYPNPNNDTKYIGIFSGNINNKILSMMDISENEYLSLLQFYGEQNVFFDISCFGWYDYKIWDQLGNNLYSGYFDDYWQ